MATWSSRLDALQFKRVLGSSTPSALAKCAASVVVKLLDVPDDPIRDAMRE
jgi:hypothetical protein